MEHRQKIIVGGLGGGGDIILALMVLKAYSIDLENVVVVSFNKCRTKRGLHDIRVKGALVRVPPSYFSSRRVFEDKLYLLEPRLANKTYIVCARDSFNNVVEGLEWIIENYRPEVLLHSDIGGDSLIIGYEKKLGSYKTDTIARASLALIAKKYKVKSYLAVSCVGCEGGGGELDHYELAANLEYAANKGALVKTILLPRDIIRVGYEALRYADSGMLPMFLAALRGKTQVEIHRAYLHGKYEIKPWYKCTYVLDNVAYCGLSPICRNLAEKGELPLRRGNKPRKRLRADRLNPNATLERICRLFSNTGKFL